MNSIFGENYFLEKADNSDVCKRYVVICFTHMLKYQYQKQRQGTSWIESIINSRNKAYGLLKNKNTYNSVSNDIDKIYLSAVKGAKDEIGNNIHESIPEYRSDDYSLDIISHKEKLIAFLEDNAYNNKVLEMVNIGIKKIEE